MMFTLPTRDNATQAGQVLVLRMNTRGQVKASVHQWNAQWRNDPTVCGWREIKHVDTVYNPIKMSETTNV